MDRCARVSKTAGIYSDKSKLTYSTLHLRILRVHETFQLLGCWDVTTKV